MFVPEINRELNVPGHQIGEIDVHIPTNMGEYEFVFQLHPPGNQASESKGGLGCNLQPAQVEGCLPPKIDVERESCNPEPREKGIRRTNGEGEFKTWKFSKKPPQIFSKWTVCLAKVIMTVKSLLNEDKHL